MNKMFTIIKGWILLQMINVKNWWVSLFADNKLEALQKPTAAPKSSGMHFNLREETTTTLDEEPTEDVLVIDPLDPISPQMTIPQELLNTDTEPLLQQDISLLYDGKYDQYFDTPNIPVPMSYVNEEIWDSITNKLRDDYVIPSNSAHSLYQNN